MYSTHNILYTLYYTHTAHYVAHKEGTRHKPFWNIRLIKWFLHNLTIDEDSHKIWSLKIIESGSSPKIGQENVIICCKDMAAGGVIKLWLAKQPSSAKKNHSRVEIFSLIKFGWWDTRPQWAEKVSVAQQQMQICVKTNSFSKGEQLEIHYTFQTFSFV